jgi:hypothetical protein
VADIYSRRARDIEYVQTKPAEESP